MGGADAHENVGDALRKIDAKAAITEYEKALGIRDQIGAPCPWLQANYGYAQLEDHQLDNALMNFRKACEIRETQGTTADPGFALATGLIGRTLATKKEYDKAFEHFDASL